MFGFNRGAKDKEKIRRGIGAIEVVEVALCVGISLASVASPAFSWDGTNSETGDCVEIGEGNLVRSGEEIEIYDCATESYRYVEIEGFDSSGYGLEIEVYDSDTDEYIYLEMDE
ncbi:DUF5334 family protein [Tabrizicola sp.]|uniref:DUF5334 family protein n=1 Tax=Tabrizicola sp. TaxID=2005166 RepID=UPI003D283582